MGTTAEKLAYLNNTKTAIKEAIVAKGVDVPVETPFRTYANKIGEIQTAPDIKTITVTITNLEGPQSDGTFFYGYPMKSGEAVAYIKPDGTRGSYTFQGNEDLVANPLVIEVMANTAISFMLFYKCYLNDVTGTATWLDGKTFSTGNITAFSVFQLFEEDVHFNHEG